MNKVIFGIIVMLTLLLVSSACAQVKVGVETGDWVKYDYTISGTSSGSIPQWIKAEFLNVTGTTVTARVTMHMADGTEQNQTMTLDVATSTGTTTFQGLLIPANSSVGDTIYISGYGNLTIAGETTRTYVGASRTVLYVDFSQSGTQLTYYWDKQTGIMTEVTAVSSSMSGSAKVTSTNIFGGLLFGLEPTIFYILVAAVIIAVVVVAIFLAMRRKKTTEVTSSQPKET
jgi:hypothetical protein